jgi:hypothetical protein
VPGLAGEYGEVLELLLTSTVDKEAMKKELGDQLWFVAVLSDLFDYKMEEVVFTEEFEDLDEFQNLVFESLFDLPIEVDSLVYELGYYIGDLNSLFAKAVRDNHGDVPEDKIGFLVLTLANIVFSTARLGAFYDITLEEMMEKNIDKLFSRKARGTLSGSGDDR